MKQKLTLLILALVMSMGAWADGTWNITSTDLSTDGWADMSGSVPAGVTALGSYTPYYRTESISVTQTGLITITFRYTTGYDQLIILGVDLLDDDDNVVASDYHWGKSGGNQDANNYLVTASSTGSYKLRYIINKDGNLDNSKGTITISKIVYADSYANITQWYKIRMHSNQTHYLKSNGSALSFTDATDDTNNYLWAFVGNPTDGFQIYSYNYGSTKAIDNSTPCGFTTSGTTNAIKLTGGRSGSTTGTKFCVSMKNGGDYYNYQSGSIKRWSGNDEGSAFIFEVATPVSLVEGSTELAPIYYAWRTAVGNSPAYMYTENGAPKNPNNTAPSFTDPIDAKYAWQFIGDAASGFAIKNKATGTYLGGRTASGGAMSMDASATCYFIPIYNSASNNKWYCKNYNYYIDRSSNAPYAHTAGNNNDYIRLYNVKFSLSDVDAGLVVGSTTISDFSAYYLITTSATLSCETSGYVISAYDGYSTLSEALENDADGTINLTVVSSVSVTYNMMFNGNLITSTVVEEAIGSTASTPSVWDVPAYCSFTCPATEITATPSPIEVTLNWNGPFTLSTDYASATWYYLTLNGLYVASNGADAKPTLSSEMVTGDVGQWAFLGNPYSGVQVINKALVGYYLQDTESNPTMTTTASNWELQQHNDKFMLWSTTRNKYFDGYSGVGYYGEIWGACEDCAVIQVPSNYYSWVTANVTPFFTAGSGYFYLDSDKSGYSAVKAIYDAAVASETCTEANYSTLVAYVGSLDNYILPPTGYYRLKNYYYPTYYMNAETASPNGITSNTTAGTVVYLTKTDNTYTMQMQGSYLQTPAQSAQVGLSGSSVTFTPSVGKAGWASFNAGGNYYGNLHMNSSKSIVGWSAVGIETNKASYWEVEDATTFTVPLNGPVDGSYYATLCVPFDVTLDGATAYTLDLNAAKTALTMTEVEGTVAAGTPIFLRHTEGTVVATIASNAAYVTSPLTTTALTGTYLDKPVTIKTDYFLGKANDKVGFYLWDGTTLKANRAYLEASKLNNSGVKGFALDFEDDATGINEELRMKNEESSIYNLAGQRMNKMQKGINIINGKKILK